MKLRNIFLVIFLAIGLSACNLTLAEDVTPPPDYVPPTPMPTLGPLYPASAPSVANGAAIYTEKCAPCHGNVGLGDGPQGQQLGVPVKAFGLPEIARPDSPDQYYTTVTRGNMDRFMPPFASLTDQERWDVIAYVLTLHTTPDQVAKGKQLFETNCANCSTDFFKNEEQMSKLSDVDLARLIRQGSKDVPAFGKNLSDDDLWALAAYLRTLSFETAPLAQPTVISATETPVASSAGTPSAEGTPVGTEQASVGSAATQVLQPGFGSVSGSIENKTGADLPADLAVTLHGYDHSSTSTNATPTANEVITKSGTVNADGSYSFDNVELSDGRIFIAEVTYDGVTLQSDFGLAKQGESALALPVITLYPITEDTSALVVDQMHLFFQANNTTSYDVLALFNFRNTGSSVVAVKMGSQQEIPFLKFPTGAQGRGYEATQDGAPLISIDQGFALAPKDQQYGIVAYSSVARQSDTAFTQQFVLPTKSLNIFVPDGVEVKGDNLTSEGPQNVQGTIYQLYTANDIQAGSSLTFDLSGTPKVTGSTTTTPAATSGNNTILLGAVALGIVFIFAGVFLYWRDRKNMQNVKKEDTEEEKFESSEEVLDAILALDDLHRTKKITDEAYQKRRTELKETLKGML